MKIEALYLSDELPKIRRELQRLQLEQAEYVGKRTGEIISSLLLRTTRHWNESGENKFPVPEPRVTVDVKQAGKAIEVEIHIVMIDPIRNTPHFVWHILTQGRRAYTFPEGKRTPPLKERRRRRTSKDTLSVEPFGGFTGETFVIHGGTRVKAVEGNNWYETVVKEFAKIRKKDPQLSGWKFHYEIGIMRKKRP